MAAKALVLGSVLRILTPEEISYLTTTSEADSRMPLTDVIRKYQQGHLTDFSERLNAKKYKEEGEGKILHFERPGTNEATILQCGPEVAEHLHTLGGEDFAETVNAVQSEQDSSSFILSEKRRLEKNSAKMRSREVLKMYQQTASVDIQAERSLKEDLSKSTQLGILVDRKQA